MSRVTGKYAYVNGVPCTTSWGMTESTTVTRYQASCVPDASGTTPGNTDFNGTMTGLGYMPPFPDGEDIPFIGVANGKTGELLNYVGTIIVNECTVTIPINAGTPIEWAATWSAQGEITKQSPSVLTEDPTRSPAASATHGKVAIENVPDSGTFTDVDAVQNITLVFRRLMARYVDDGFMYSEVGNLESELTFRTENDDLFIPLYERNTTKLVRVYVTPTLFYLFDAVTWREKANFTVDRRANAMVGYDVNGYWTAIREQTPPALGEIILPDSTNLYPAPA